MKFLIDAQLPSILKTIFRENGFEAIHTKDLPKKNLISDLDILQLSNEQQWIVITKDSDFYHSFMIRKEPHKLIFVRVGNMGLDEVKQFFRNNISSIIDLISKGNLVELKKDEIKILY
jgi:predicted nuclease of predicted toxin-antitoxin system